MASPKHDKRTWWLCDHWNWTLIKWLTDKIETDVFYRFECRRVEWLKGILSTAPFSCTDYRIAKKWRNCIFCTNGWQKRRGIVIVGLEVFRQHLLAAQTMTPVNELTISASMVDFLTQCHNSGCPPGNDCCFYILSWGRHKRNWLNVH
jgi:hypothetical protein